MLLYLHLGTIIPVVLLGPFILMRKKGDRFHRNLGKFWAFMMVISCLLSFGVRGPDGGLSWLHGLAAFTIYSVINGILKIRKGDIRGHQRNMVGPYIGAIIAMFFAFYGESRLLGQWIRSLFH